MCFLCRSEGMDRAASSDAAPCAAAALTVIAKDGEAFTVPLDVAAQSRLLRGRAGVVGPRTTVPVDGPTLRLLLDFCRRARNVQGDAELLRIACE